MSSSLFAVAAVLAGVVAGSVLTFAIMTTSEKAPTPALVAAAPTPTPCELFQQVTALPPEKLAPENAYAGLPSLIANVGMTGKPLASPHNGSTPAMVILADDIGLLFADCLQQIRQRK